jgi:hypothetical protein
MTTNRPVCKNQARVLLLGPLRPAKFNLLVIPDKRLLATDAPAVLTCGWGDCR